MGSSQYLDGQEAVRFLDFANAIKEHWQIMVIVQLLNIYLEREAHKASIIRLPCVHMLNACHVTALHISKIFLTLKSTCVPFSECFWCQSATAQHNARIVNLK